MIRQALALGAVVAFSVQAHAALLVYEPFDYTAGQRLLGQSNSSTGTSWLLAAGSAAAGDTSAINTAAGNLTPPSALPAAQGNQLAITGAGNSSGAANRLAFNSAGTAIGAGNTVYYSFLLRVDDLAGSNTGVGGFFVGLNNTGNAATTVNPSAVAARLQGRIDPSDATKFNLGIFNNRNAVTAPDPNTQWSGALNVGETYFIVGAYEMIAGASNDLSHLWINPVLDTTAPSPHHTDTVGATTDLSIASIIVRQSPAPHLTMDELRVGTAWLDVVPVPEPSALALLGLGGLGLLARRRRQA